MWLDFQIKVMTDVLAVMLAVGRSYSIFRDIAEKYIITVSTGPMGHSQKALLPR
jgi:hypothetical protein